MSTETARRKLIGHGKIAMCIMCKKCNKLIVSSKRNYKTSDGGIVDYDLCDECDKIPNNLTIEEMTLGNYSIPDDFIEI